MSVPDVIASGSVRYEVIADGVVISEHSMLYKAQVRAQEIEQAEPGTDTKIRTEQIYRVVAKNSPPPPPPPPTMGNWAPLFREIPFGDGETGWYMDAESLFPAEFREMPDTTRFRSTNKNVISLPGGRFDPQGEQGPFDFELEHDDGYSYATIS